MSERVQKKEKLKQMRQDQ